MAAMEKNNNNLNVPNLRFPEFDGEWETHRLGELVEIKSGVSPTGIIDENGLFPFYKVEQLNNCYVELNETPYLTMQSSVPVHGIIFPKRGAAIMTNKIRIASKPCQLDTNLMALIIENNEKVDYKFLFYFIARYNLSKIADTSTIPQINNIHINPLKITLPSFKEQQKISALLTVLDLKIDTQRKIIEKYESLIRGLYHSVFNQPASTLQLKDVVSVVKGQQVNGEELLEYGKYYVMNGGTEPSGYLDVCNTPANTISISEGGNSCGYVQYNTEPFWSGGHCYSLIQKEQSVNYQYLYHFLKYKERNIMALRIGSGLPNVQKKDLERFEIRVLPTKQQNRVAEILEDVSAKCDLEKRILQGWQCQKSYLLHNLFI